MNKLIEESTDNLMKVLTNAGAEDVNGFLDTHFSGGQPTFVQYVDGLLEEKGLKRQLVLLRAGLPQKYGYKLLTGESHTTDRDKILRICLAMELDLKQTQRALRLYGMSELYPKVKRDVFLIAAISRRRWDIDEISAGLAQAGLAPLYTPEP